MSISDIKPDKPATPEAQSAPAATATSPAVASPTKDYNQGGHWMGAFKAFSAIFNRLSPNTAPLGVFAAIYAAMAVFSLTVTQSDTLTVFRTILSGGTPPPSQPLDNLPLLVSLLLIVPTYKMALALADNRVATIEEIFKFKPLHLVYVLLSGLVVVTALFLGALLLLIPLIWLLPWFSMVVFAIIDRNEGPLQSINTSHRLTKADLDKVWGVIGVTILINIVAFILLLIPVVGDVISSLIGIVATGALALLYRWLVANHKPDEDAAAKSDGPVIA